MQSEHRLPAIAIKISALTYHDTKVTLTKKTDVLSSLTMSGFLACDYQIWNPSCIRPFCLWPLSKNILTINQETWKESSLVKRGPKF